MLVIDGDYNYLINKLNLTPQKLEEYGTKTVDEILEAEAAAGNQAAIKIVNEMYTNVAFLVEIFKLADPENKYMILSQMNSQQLQEFLPLMEEEDLQQGLMYFSMDKLLDMMEDLPPEQLVKAVFEMFSQEEIIQYMPEDQLDKVLTGPELDKNKVLEHLKSIPPEYLAQMIENVTGEPLDEMDSLGMINQIGGFNPTEYKDALTGMQSTQKQQLMLSLCKENPELYQLFAAEEYTNIINTYKQKPQVVKALEVIEKEETIKMLKELPNDLLSMVITQIDPDTFGDMLLKKHADLLAQVVMM